MVFKASQMKKLLVPFPSRESNLNLKFKYALLPKNFSETTLIVFHRIQPMRPSKPLQSPIIIFSISIGFFIIVPFFFAPATI